MKLIIIKLYEITPIAGSIPGENNSALQTLERIENIAADAAIDQSKISGLTDTLNKKLEGVQVDGNDLTITSNKVNIPKATADALGLVKSSTGANKVSVNSDGTMSVSSVNASSIVSDTVIRISGGNASTDFSSLI